MKKLVFITILLLMAGFFRTYCQEKTITGTIISTEDGSPLPGASIVVKETVTGTESNRKGEFTLNLPKDKRFLEISFIGMKRKIIEIAGQENIIISMTPDVVSTKAVSIIYDTISGTTRCIPEILEKD